MRHLTIISVFSFLLLTSCGSGSKTVQVTVKNLNPEEFSRLLDSIPNEQLVDVRTADEFGKGHIENAINYDWNGDLFSTEAAALNKDVPVFVYCLSGGRSAEASNWFIENGYQTVYQLAGGIRAWENADLPEVTTAAVTNVVPGEITTAAYVDFLKQHPVVLVDFSATWCGPCKHLAPKIEELKTELDGKFELLSADVDRDRALSDSMNIESMPTLIIYRNSQIVWRTVGDIEKSELKKAILDAQ